MRHLEREDIEYLLELVHDNPNFFLDELVSLARANRFISVHFTTIFNELERAGMSRKKLKRIASERNEELGAVFLVRMCQYATKIAPRACTAKIMLIKLGRSTGYSHCVNKMRVKIIRNLRAVPKKS